MKTAAKEAIAAGNIPAGFVDITTIPVEAEVACRAASKLELVGPNGIFTDLKMEQRFVPFLGMEVELLVYILTLNTPHRIDVGVPIKGCNQDGVVFVAATSKNILAVAPPQFSINGIKDKKTVLTLSFTRKDLKQAATLGFRVKFEENVGTDRTKTNPKRKAAALSFNPTPRL